MNGNPDPLAKIKPLTDPLHLLAIYFLCSGFLCWGLLSWATRLLFGSIGDGWAIGLGLACVLWGGAILIAPGGKPSAIYLRAFKTDRQTARLRLRLAAILGPDLRLSGIRPPAKKSSALMRCLLPGLVALRYAGSKYMDLEAGDDWMARLWRSYQRTRLVFVDLRELTPHVHHEIQLTLKTMGVERCIFLIGPGRTGSEWRALISHVAGEALDPAALHLLDVAPERMRNGQMAADLRAFLQSLPPGVPGETAHGRAFVLANVSPSDLAKSRRIAPRIAAALAASAAILLIASYLFVKLPGVVRQALLIPFTLVVAFLVLASLLRSFARAVRLARAGHPDAAIRAFLALAAAALLLGAGGAAVAAGIRYFAFDYANLVNQPTQRQQMGDTTAYVNLKSIAQAEIAYAAAYPDIGFSCSLAALGGNPASGPPTSQAAQFLSQDLASGQSAGYAYSFTYCHQEKSKNGVMKGTLLGLQARPLTPLDGLCTYQVSLLVFEPAVPVVDEQCNSPTQNF